MPQINRPSKPIRLARADLAKDMGDRIRRKMAALRLHGAEVARRIGISERTYNYYVTGQRMPDPGTLYDISTVLEMTLEELLGVQTELHRDEPAYLAHRRILMACQRLGSGQIETIADMTEYIEAKHQNAVWKAASHPLRHLHEIAILHERLIPEFIKQFELEEMGTRMEINGRIMAFFVTASFPEHAKFAHLKRVIEEMINDLVPPLASKCKVIFRMNLLEIEYRTIVERER
jgi:transcriptional regulator with XRE-family HTH domain